MPEQIKNVKQRNYAVSFLFSVLFHFLMFLLAAYIFSFNFDKPLVNSVYLTFKKNESPFKPELNQEMIKYDKVIPEPEDKEESSSYYFGKTEYDTSAIKQVYRESTLDLSVRYPNGWIYIDQNVKNKLDGVTFWAAVGNYEIPPYVHLEVQDKYIFNPSRFKYKLEHKENIFYYNQPEELEGYFTQIIYIRTESDEDYSLKLMVKGKESFLSFQPVFFSMAKSLRFRNSFF